jgi:hypothetical protein
MGRDSKSHGRAVSDTWLFFKAAGSWYATHNESKHAMSQKDEGRPLVAEKAIEKAGDGKWKRTGEKGRELIA